MQGVGHWGRRPLRFYFPGNTCLWRPGGSHAPALLPKDNVPLGGSCPLRCGKRFLSPQASAPLPPHAAGRASRPYAMSLVPQRARGRSLRTTSPGQKALPRHRLLHRQKLPPLPVNKTPRQDLRLPCQDCPCPAEGKNALQGRDALPCRDKRPSLKASLVPLELFFEALHVNPAACRFAAKNAVSPLTFGRTALCHSAPDKWARMGGAGYRPAETSFLAGPVRYARHRKKTAHRRYRQGQAHCGLTKTCNTISYNLSM